MQLFKRKLWFRHDYLIISNEEITAIMKIFKFREKPGLLIKRVRETYKNEAKEQKFGFLGMLVGTLATSLFVNLLADKPKIPGQGAMTVGKGTIRAREDF